MADGNKPRRIVAKPIHPPTGGDNAKKPSKRRLWASVCYYYPQYTLEDAAKLSARDIRLLLSTAKRIEAEHNYNLVQIVTAPHTEKGKGVRDLSNYFQQEMEK